MTFQPPYAILSFDAPLANPPDFERIPSSLGNIAMTKGDDVKLNVYIRVIGFPADLTHVPILTFIARREITDTPAEAVVNKPLTIVSAARGWMLLSLAPNNTSGLPSDKVSVLSYEIILDDNGHTPPDYEMGVHTVLTGSMIVRPN